MQHRRTAGGSPVDLSQLRSTYQVKDIWNSRGSWFVLKLSLKYNLSLTGVFQCLKWFISLVMCYKTSNVHIQTMWVLMSLYFYTFRRTAEDPYGSLWAVGSEKERMRRIQVVKYFRQQQLLYPKISSLFLYSLNVKVFTAKKELVELQLGKHESQYWQEWCLSLKLALW